MRDQGPAGECSLPRGQPQHRGRTKPLPSSALCPQVCPGLAGETQALLPREQARHPGSWQGLRDLAPLPREGAALPSCHNPLAHHDIPRLWLPGGSEASSYLGGNATSSEQRPLISVSPPARRLLYGGFQQCWLWHSATDHAVFSPVCRQNRKKGPGTVLGARPAAPGSICLAAWQRVTAGDQL